jgi:hypothetical protein
MSDPGGFSTPPPGATPPPQRSGCLTAFMLVAGIILMLPGLCAIIVGASSARFDPSLAMVVLLCLMIGLGGLALIVSAVRGRR